MANSGLILRRVRKWFALDASERLLLLRALGCLAAVRIGLFCLPFRFFTGPPRVTRSRGMPPDRLIWAINAMAPCIPGAACLVRALAAQRLFALNGVAARVCVGVTRPEPSTFAAHAWLECDNLRDLSPAGNFTTLITLE